jgi:DNA-binding beta-propeller fold protein YncE
MGRFALAVAVVALTGGLINGSLAQAAPVQISDAGSGAGETLAPRGVALDFKTGYLYVADSKNNRVAVFNAAGEFKFAFGWGVLDGAAELQTCTSICQAGLAGSGSGQFNNPTGIAIDNSSFDHNVYVSDFGNKRVQKFSTTGSFLLTFGGDVNKTTGGDVCTEGSGDACGQGTSGFQPGEFSTAGAVDLPLATSEGNVYVSDWKFSGGEYSSRLQIFSGSGAQIREVSLGAGAVAAIAADSVGDVYVKTEAPGSLKKYDSEGHFLETINQHETSALGVSAIDLLVAAESEAFLGIRYQILTLRNSSSEVVSRFGYLESGSVQGLAVEADGVYASEGDIVRLFSFPDPGPIPVGACGAGPIGNTKATLVAPVNPEGKATTTHFEYVDDASFQSEGGFASPNTETTPESGSIGSDFVLHQASAEVDVKPETVYHCRVVATNADDEATGEAGTFKSLPPFEIAATFATGVSFEEATLNAAVKPFGIPATGWFEYVEEQSFDATGFDTAQRAPLGEDIDFGSSATGTEERSVQIGGLTPGTRYRYRVVVADSFFPDGIPGPTKAFRTFGTAAEVPDDRGYELVSPGQKDGADVAVPGAAGGLFDDSGVRITAASPDGTLMTYTSFVAFGDDVLSAPSASQYLSRRTPDGWSTENVNLFGTRQVLLLPFVGFSPDLGFSGVIVEEPAVTLEAIDGVENLYLRNNTTGQIQTITTEPPQVSAGEKFCIGFAGVTPDGKHAIFSANGAVAGAPKGKGFSLYEWTEGEGVSLVSVLPDETPAIPSEKSTFGAVGFQNCSVGQKRVANAISDDGQRIFWTYVPKSGPRALMARVDGDHTIQLDQAEPGATGPSGNGKFQAASPDGSHVLFTDQNALAPGTGPGHIYRYDLTGEGLEDLTPGPGDPQVQGIVGHSKDLSYVYFVAKGVLTAALNSEGQAAVDEAFNLYVYHRGEPLRFIGPLTSADEGAWVEKPTKHTAHVTPDGKALAFTSVNAKKLSGFDNVVGVGEHCERIEGSLAGDPLCSEVFLYDWTSDSLVCASCNPTGGQPSGPSYLNAWSNPLEQTHIVSDGGQRVFFESMDELSPTDKNGRFDVYEYERKGLGSCSDESPQYVETSFGCIYLISTGNSDEGSFLLDASSDGEDVFFSTRERILSARDQDSRYDVYDYKIGGGFAELTEPGPCGGPSSCLPSQSHRPPAATPPTATFNGAGNVTTKPKKKHHKKHKKRHHRKHHHKKHRNADRGARR